MCRQSFMSEQGRNQQWPEPWRMLQHLDVAPRVDEDRRAQDCRQGLRRRDDGAPFGKPPVLIPIRIIDRVRSLFTAAPTRRLGNGLAVENPCATFSAISMAASAASRTSGALATRSVFSATNSPSSASSRIGARRLSNRAAPRSHPPRRPAASADANPQRSRPSPVFD